MAPFRNLRRPPLTFTLDLEDHRPGPEAPLRYESVVHDLLAHLAERSIRGTFFVVGTVAEDSPELVSAVADAGHEIALHDWDHTQLERSTPARLRETATRGRALLSELAGQDVIGYRAATFSLTAATTWATDVLAEAGFAYSSSVLPAANALYGFAGAPDGPFRWPSGLVELPATVVDLGVIRVPLGGTYLRLLPARLMASRTTPSAVPFLYCHPYDFDPEEPFWWEPVAGALAPLLWVGRRRMTAKVDSLLGNTAPPLCERLDALGELPMFRPPSASARSQLDMIHRLPDADVVDRIEFLTEAARGRRVTHVGFVDQGCRDMQDRTGSWLHGHLATVAAGLVGIDLDAAGVAEARAAGFEAHAVDCRDAAAVVAAGIEPADVVVAGEVIEHLDAPGPFLDALHRLVAPGGRLVVTTPNAAGLFNTVAALVNREVNHPDHVVSFTWRTLTRLLADHGWTVEHTATFVPEVKEGGLRGVGARAVTAAERAGGAFGRPFLADGLIVTCRSSR